MQHVRARLRTALFGLALMSGCASSHDVEEPECECPSGESCVLGACVASCDLDDDALAMLDPSLEVVRSFCLELAEGPVGARALPDGDLELFHAHASTVGRETEIVLDRLEATVATGGVRGSAACTTTFTADADDVAVELLPDLAVSPDDALVAWGLRAGTMTPTGSTLFVPGAWYLARHAGCSIQRSSFPRPVGVAFGAGGRVLVSGGLGGPVSDDGVFLDGARVLAESTPGSIWRVGDALLVGGVLGHGVMPATWIPLASIRPGVEVQRGIDGVLSGDAREFRFVALEGRGIVAEAPFVTSTTDRQGLEIRSLDVSGGGLVFGEPTLLAGPEITSAIPIQGSSRFLLRHARGLLLVE